MKLPFHELVARVLEHEVVRLLRSRPVTVVAVTGSVGKTSTKRAIAHVLGTRYAVLSQPGNYNTRIGVPLSIFEVETPDRLWDPFAWAGIWRRVRRRVRQPWRYQVLVLELGAGRPGDIATFLRYLRPEVGVVTAVGTDHLEAFGSPEAILEEKLRLARASPTVLLNGDDPALEEERAELRGRRVLTYGLNQAAVRFERQVGGPGGPYQGILHLPAADLDVRLNLVGTHNLYAAVAAAAVGDLLGLSPREIRAGLESLRPAPGRMSPLPGKNGSLILDDSYSANPTSVVAALETLLGMPGRKLALLGSMHELGAASAAEHAGVGRRCAGLDLLVTLGSEAERWLRPEAVRAGLAPDRVRSFDSPYEAGRFLAAQLAPGDRVLVKGSARRIFAEEAIKHLLAQPEDASRLVRQERRWWREKERALGVRLAAEPPYLPIENSPVVRPRVPHTR